MKKKEFKEEEIETRVNEPLVSYFQSVEFLKSYKKVTFSSQEDQENANRIFSASLTPLQRMEYLYILNSSFLSRHLQNLPKRFTKLYFD